MRDGVRDGAHRVEIALLAGKGRIEIDDVQIVAALLLPAARKGRGIAGIDGLLFGLALAQAHHFAGHEIDRGQKDHSRSARLSSPPRPTAGAETCAMKLRSMRRPTAWLFSG